MLCRMLKSFGLGFGNYGVGLSKLQALALSLTLSTALKVGSHD